MEGNIQAIIISKMNIIEKYYMRKANMGSQDTFYDKLEPGDIQLLRNAQLYMFLAPVFAIGVVHLMRKLKSELLMSQHFYYIIKQY